MKTFFNITKYNKILQKWYLHLVVFLLGLISFCMFVVQELSEKQSDIYFFTIRERSWVSDFERVASPIFDSSCSPKGALAYNLISDMQERNTIVTNSAYANVTATQNNKLQNLLGESSFKALTDALATETDFLNLLQVLRKMRTTSFNVIQKGVALTQEDKQKYHVLNNVTAALMASDLSNQIFER